MSDDDDPRHSDPLERLERLDAGVDARVGHRKLLARALYAPIVGGARWAYVFGAVLTTAFAVEAVTGALLAATYSPGTLTAWSSVHHISFAMAGGWLVRGLHFFAAQAMIVTLGLHVAQVTVFGAYKKPREVNWWVGLALLALTLAFVVTGHLLPWDQKGYWATQLSMNLVATGPVGGGTLTWSYVLHVVVLPGGLVALLVAHVALFRKHGVTPGAQADTKKADPFFPKQLGRDLAASLAVVGLLFFLTYASHGAPLDAPADPASAYPARPEWYAVPLFELLEYTGRGFALALAGALAAYLVALPRLDAVETTALGPRMNTLAPLILAACVLLLLTWSAVRTDKNDAKFQAARKAADARAAVARELAMGGVPVAGGPLEMLRRDPALRGEELFAARCASCHVLGELGDRATTTAPSLDGWGTEAWILGTLHAPDAPLRFGRSPYAGAMKSFDVKPDGSPESWTAMPREEMLAVASFLAAQGDEPGEEVPALAPRRDPMLRQAGEAIFEKECMTCHVFEGKGDSAKSDSVRVARVAPEMSRYGSLSWTRAVVANPAASAAYRAAPQSTEKEGYMPRFDAELTADDVALVARWARAKARGMPLRPGAP